MKPDELKSLREAVDMFDYPETSLVRKALAHIDEQANQASKLEAMLIEERARANYIQSFIRLHVDFDGSDLKQSWMDIAASELGIEVNSWKHIGLEEQKAIQRAIAYIETDARFHMEDPSKTTASEDLAVLRKLLEGKPCLQ
jgi:hypothetical protein